ncbi:UDP-N-acetylmuramyl tripeptide synthase [Streptoalloteichus hindustanus]|uniref:Lipid II isoglutaminyl synthase (glutamine-hydrolyzing) subunit MurT n=1 Tax=Streptoalloteichus hindustanus TaxID=2017 RepID=A0A1M5NE45_STRHI|nr:UDP-N-acetylmuramyl tripeptide synthase [Streptoalloteichus hindustanus]
MVVGLVGSRDPGGKRRRTLAATKLGKGAAWLSRTAGLGEGGIIGGRVAMALDRDVLSGLASGRTVVLVTGTNGKTTTTSMVTRALSAAGPVASNSTGANMPDGHVAALMARPEARYAVLEVDEMHLDIAAEQTKPAVILLLNLSRDQIDRVGEVRTVAARLRQVVVDSPQAVVVANADDPMVVFAAEPAQRVVWVSVGGGRWTGDATSCPKCGERIDVSVERWACACGLRRPEPAWAVRDQTVITDSGRELALQLNLPGQVNYGNAALAMAAVAQLGVVPEAALPRIREVSEVAGRYGDLVIGGRKVRLLLAKNPAGWHEMLQLVRASGRPVMLVVNAREADGFDLSWLWDVPFEQLAGLQVVVAGERAADMAVRLRYARVDVTMNPDPVEAVRMTPPGDLDVIANYTAFRMLRVKGEA